MLFELIVVILFTLLLIGIIVYDKYTIMKELHRIKNEEDEIEKELTEILKDVSH